MPRADMRGRLLEATGAFVLGVAFCFAMYRWLTPYAYPSPGQALAWLFAAIPFAALALLIVAGLRRSMSVPGWIVLATLTVLAFTAGAEQWAGSSTAGAAMFFQVFYGLIFVVLLGGRWRVEGKPLLRADPTTARRLAIVLLVFTVLAFLPSVAPWDAGTPGAFEVGVAFTAPLWLSTAFALRQLARGQARRTAAVYLWFGATFLGLLILFAAVGLSHVTFGD